MLCIFVPLSIAAISDNYTRVPEKNYETIFPENYNELSERNKLLVIQSHNYQTCVYSLTKENGSSVTTLANKISDTCTILTVNKD